MNRRGAVLFVVLWLMVLLGGGAIAVLRELREGTWKSRNRIALIRAEWAVEGCLELILSRGYRHESMKWTDSTALGDGLWCRYHIDDPQARLNLNLAPWPMLRSVLGDTVAAAVLDWRDPDSDMQPLGAEAEWYQGVRRTGPRNGSLRSLRELDLIKGGSEASIRSHVTVWGSGRINLNTASRDVLLALPGVDTAFVDALLIRRRAGVAPTSLRARSSEEQPVLDQLVAVAPDFLVATIAGGTGQGSVATETLILVPAQDRLALIRRLWTVEPCDRGC